MWGGCVVAVAPQTFTQSTKMMVSTCVTDVINSAKVHIHQHQAAAPVPYTCRMSCKSARKEQVPRATAARFRSLLHGRTEDRTVCPTIQVLLRGAITFAISLFL